MILKKIKEIEQQVRELRSFEKGDSQFIQLTNAVLPALNKRLISQNEYRNPNFLSLLKIFGVDLSFSTLLGKVNSESGIKQQSTFLILKSSAEPAARGLLEKYPSWDAFQSEAGTLMIIMQMSNYGDTQVMQLMQEALR